MTKPAAKQGSAALGLDTHVVLVPSPAGAVPTPLPLPFVGTVCDELSDDVLINGVPAAVVGSVAQNQPPHVAPAGTFQSPPSNRGRIRVGSGTVLINCKPAARNGDTVDTCNDPVDAPNAVIVAAGNVLIAD